MRGICLVVAAAVLAGCGNGGDQTTERQETETSGDATTAATTVEETIQCTNEEDGFTVAYPPDWHTNTGEVAPTCSFFHPEPFDLPEASEAVGIAIRVDREPVAFEDAAGPSPAREVLEREETTVAGRPAVRLEYEATGDGLLDRGTRGVDYLVDLDGETLVASTLDVGGLDFERNVQVLDELVDTIELTR